MADKQTVLIVDDQLSARELLRGLLVPDGYELAIASSGAEIFAHFQQNQPDVILLDVMMPEMDGFEVCRRLRSDDHWQHIPIILVTALDSKEHLAQGIEAGADDFIHKPVNGLEVRARVRSMLRIKRQFDQLQATLELRDELAQMVVHDMRSPLTAILGYAELLKRNLIPADNQQAIDHIFEQTQHLNALVDEILATAKMEQGYLHLDRLQVDLDQIMQRAVAAQRLMADSRNITLVLKLPSKARPIWLDANLFQRVVDNLLANALKFAPSDSEVTLQLEYPKQQHLRLSVLDQGPGIAKADRERIFDKFEVVDMQHRGASQVGLGLAFCKLVIEAHGGHIFVTANQPKGAVFTVEI